MFEQNQRVVRRFLTEVCNKGNIALIDDLFACDWVGHAPRKEFNGPEELKQFVAAQRLAFPNLNVRLEDLNAEGDRLPCAGSSVALPRPFKRPANGRTSAGLPWLACRIG
jgi:SnoaL-like polyketide cyclase.